MAFTTDWVWVSINRTQDTNTSGDDLLVRNNWTLTRKRISNDAYSGELGEESDSLSAYNGGVTETVTPPTTTVLTFTSLSVDCNWTTTSQKWVPTGTIANGYPTYSPWRSASLPNSSVVNLVEAIDVSGSEEWTVSDNAGNFTRTTGATGWANLDGAVFSFNGGTFTGSATANLNENGVLNFYCSSDSQSYESDGADWFTQTQTWIYKDSFE